MKQFKIISIRGRREWCALNCFFFSLSFLSMSTFCCQDKCFKKKFIRIICFSYAMPNLNPWQKIYSKTKYKRSKRERVITIGFELVFFVLKREKIYWNITFHLFLKCSENLGVSVLVFHVFFSCFYEVCILEYSADRGKGTFIPVFIWSTHTDVSLWSCSYLWNYR